MTNAHNIASTFDVGLQRLASAAYDMHLDRVEARHEATLVQRDRRMSAVGRVARRVREDAETIADLQAEIARLHAEADAWRMRALGAEGRLEDVKGALRTLRDARRAG